ncbi:DUF4156 domain-containing protein [Thermomonas sp.]|jgi:hypothetical protein|uniref:DUF4156 domain-containing protein n=1 Tax=Thermomonas sp. TaxID=1971895 RepID=UPI001B61FA20|nr:DUF4156 domain-containing protein [Thermomonas sp.]MBK6415198.1 DUF4156 domain-containing protein [Thermomonas sp.]MBK7205938.1 DUF4156 domain-containing protein [Thermomonas sp.]MBL0228557.1 DUF4156 domain-containing protein [Thermomonas sp.]MBP7159427.1 DUF4156 domain-containing protein [Thermomonas sp.]MBP7789712.1 DUF4156 domain-containing protein [Thermomonas sp.]
MKVKLLASMLAFLLTACTFVHMAPGATGVKVLATAPANCQKRGEVAVSVKDRLGPYERSEAQVRDELETLARNEAPGLGADRISPLSPVDDGEQRWALWRCGR